MHGALARHSFETNCFYCISLSTYVTAWHHIRLRRLYSLYSIFPTMWRGMATHSFDTNTFPVFKIFRHVATWHVSNHLNSRYGAKGFRRAAGLGALRALFFPNPSHTMRAQDGQVAAITGGQCHGGVTFLTVSSLDPATEREMGTVAATASRLGVMRVELGSLHSIA